MDHNCKWHLCATRLIGCNMLEIRKYCNPHIRSLDLQQRDHRQTSSKISRYDFRYKYSGVSFSYKPANIRKYE